MKFNSNFNLVFKKFWIRHNMIGSDFLSFPNWNFLIFGWIQPKWFYPCYVIRKLNPIFIGNFEKVYLHTCHSIYWRFLISLFDTRMSKYNYLERAKNIKTFFWVFWVVRTRVLYWGFMGVITNNNAYRKEKFYGQ